MTYRLGVDVGGTFTDFVLINDDTGTLHLGKCLTTPQDPVLGIQQGLDRLRSDLNLVPGEITLARHGTTLVANTIIERKGAKTGLLTTEGFRDILEIANDTRYDIYDMQITFPAPLVPRPLRLTLKERINAQGEPVQAPDREELRARMAELIAAGVRSVAICLLHSYRNPEHERLIRDWIESEFPTVDVSISADVAPEIREYTRTSTVVANAYVKPIMRSYLSRLQAALKEGGVAGKLFVMLSDGGVTSAETAAQVPVRLVESGPAGGVLAAFAYGKGTGEKELIAFDMGGTTAKVCLVDRGEPAFTGSIEVARLKRQFPGSGIPLTVPAIEMVEIGAGGGSIGWIDTTGLLKVGPESAGASPGPVCYGRGGERPTVTDADVLLGYLNPDFFLGGEMKLDLARAEATIGQLGQALGVSTTAAAAGIVQVVNNNMATAIRVHTAERGRDYRKYTLFTFGGAGPVHAYEVARLLKMPKLIAPLGAGTNSALGFLVAPVAIELSRSYYARLDEIDWSFLSRLYAEMEEQGGQMVAEAGVTNPRFTRLAEMRFVGQGFEVTAPIPDGELTAAALPAIKDSFAAAYRQFYQTLPGDLPIEGLTWRLKASGPPADVNLKWPSVGTGGLSRKGERPAYFPEVGDFVSTPVYDRYAMRAGDRVEGPAIFEERESTVVVGPSGRVHVDDQLSLVVELG